MRKIFLIFVVSSVFMNLSSCKRRMQPSSDVVAIDAQRKQAVIDALKKAGWDEDKIAQKIEEYQSKIDQDPNLLTRGIWVLSANDLDQKTEIKTNVIRQVLERKRQANQAIVASVGLTVVGIGLAFAPVPGAQGVGLLLIKDGMALGVIYLSLKAETAYRKGRSLEVADLKNWEPTIKNALNGIIAASPARLQVGSVTDVRINSANFIEFDTSEGVHFVTKNLNSENSTAFVTSARKWYGNLPTDDNAVLSLIDGQLIESEKYLDIQAHMLGAMSTDYQHFLGNALEQLKIWTDTTGSEHIPPQYVQHLKSNTSENIAQYTAVLNWDLDKELSAASTMAEYASVQLGIIGGRLFDNKSGADWERFQTHLRHIQKSGLAVTQPIAKNSSRLVKLQKLIDIYKWSKPVLVERAQYLEGRPFAR